jgi:hypothetical protein
MGLKEQQAAIQRELDRFIDLIELMLPRYHKLLDSENLSEDDLQELGELEHFLIGVAARVTDLKQILDQDVFGQSLDSYFKLKEKASKGDLEATKKFKRLRDTFHRSITEGGIIHWN